MIFSVLHERHTGGIFYWYRYTYFRSQLFQYTGHTAMPLSVYIARSEWPHTRCSFSPSYILRNVFLLTTRVSNQVGNRPPFLRSIHQEAHNRPNLFSHYQVLGNRSRATDSLNWTSSSIIGTLIVDRKFAEIDMLWPKYDYRRFHRNTDDFFWRGTWKWSIYLRDIS